MSETAIDVQFEGIDEFRAALAKGSESAMRAAQRIVTKGADVVAGAAKSVFKPSDPASRRVVQNPRKAGNMGKVYYVFTPPYQATPPTPQRRSGTLRQSIRRRSVMPVETGWKATVGTQVSYAPYVEFGTEHMTKEPYLKTGLEKSGTVLKALAEAEWAKALEEIAMTS